MLEIFYDPHLAIRTQSRMNLSLLRAVVELGQLKRSYAESNNPYSHNPLYALIDHRGVKRWHLLAHPQMDEKHILGLKDSKGTSPLVEGGVSIHPTLGNLEGIDLGEVTGLKMFQRKRVPVLVGNHPVFGPVLIKGLEEDVGFGGGKRKGTFDSESDSSTSKTRSTATWVEPPRTFKPGMFRMSLRRNPFKGGPSGAMIERPVKDERIAWGHDSQGLWVPRHLPLDVPHQEVMRRQGVEFSTDPYFGAPLFNTDTQDRNMSPAPQPRPFNQKRQLSEAEESRDPQATGRMDTRDSGDFNHPLAGRGLYIENARELPDIASYMSQGIANLGAVTPDYRVVPIGGLRKQANEWWGSRFWDSDERGAVVQPFIHPTHLSASPVELGGYHPHSLRMEARLTAAETILGAPDRHGENYIMTPTLHPDGTRGYQKTGIDYEWHQPGFKDGVLAGPHMEEGDPDNLFARLYGDMRGHFGDSYSSLTPSDRGIMDVLSRLDHIATDSEQLPGYSNDRSMHILSYWHEAGERTDRSAAAYLHNWVQQGREAGDLI